MILSSTRTAEARTTPGSPWRRRGLIGLAALSAYSTGIGWQAQLVSYPLFRSVGEQDFLAYHQAYNEAIPLVVIVPGFVTFLASIAFVRTRPADVPLPAAAVVAVSGAVSLLSTVLWAIPMHDRLDEVGQSPATIASLLDANLVRCVALSVGTGALLWCLGRSRRDAGREDDARR
jgi:hypothetical protein